MNAFSLVKDALPSQQNEDGDNSNDVEDHVCWLLVRIHSRRRFLNETFPHRVRNSHLCGWNRVDLEMVEGSVES